MHKQTEWTWAPDLMKYLAMATLMIRKCQSNSLSKKPPGSTTGNQSGHHFSQRLYFPGLLKNKRSVSFKILWGSNVTRMPAIYHVGLNSQLLYHRRAQSCICLCPTCARLRADAGAERCFFQRRIIKPDNCKNNYAADSAVYPRAPDLHL